MAGLDGVLRELAAEMAERTDRGTVASYIPQLGTIDPGKFGIAVALADGQVLAAGDADEAFSIQSVSKVFTLTLALGKIGDALWSRVGREPSGNPFNSIVQLEMEHGIPRNPFINAGAIVVSDVLLAGHPPRETNRRSAVSRTGLQHPLPRVGADRCRQHDGIGRGTIAIHRLAQNHLPAEKRVLGQPGG